MNPAVSLKLSAFAFIAFWFGVMAWVGGTDDLLTIFTLAFCSTATGYAWYRLMHWSFRHMSLLPFDGAGAG